MIHLKDFVIILQRNITFANRKLPPYYMKPFKNGATVNVLKFKHFNPYLLCINFAFYTVISTYT